MQAMMRYLRKILQYLYFFLRFTLVCSALLISLQPLAAQSSQGQSTIAFVTEDYDTRTMTISLVDPDSGAVTPLVNDGYFYFPMLSPDGKNLAFVGENPRTRAQNIYIISTDGSDLRRLVEDQPIFKPSGQVAWSPDSTQVIYGTLDRTLRPGKFFRVSLDSNAPVEIGFEGITEDVIDTWITASPDGSHLAILVQKLYEPYREIFIADTDGSSAHPLETTMPDGQAVDRLVWSPDNQNTLLSVLPINTTSEHPHPLMLADADGSNAQVLLTPPPNYMTSVSWSPNGSQIAFVATEMGAQGIPDGEVWVVNADGSGLRALNIPINVSYSGLSWSVIPDDVVLPSAPTSFISAID
jgi:Tol biopolymer transport system component